MNQDDDESDSTTLEDSESILDALLTAFPETRRLKWHYRSRHESLIAFSNYHFYDGDLQVFPSPHGENDTHGVVLHEVKDSNYANSVNAKEARVVAEAAIQHMKHKTNQSLAIVAMNTKQKRFIEDEVDRLLKEDVQARSYIDKWQDSTEYFVVKNLETVQGDERDVIFISFTFGPDMNGNVKMQFGPINTKHGWRRLNVLFTRAKQRVEAFSSMSPDQLKTTENSSRGARALKDYLIYAKDGKMQTSIETARGPDSPFEVEVKSRLQEKGFEIQPQVGVSGFFIDMAVRHPKKPGTYLMGIECDGATYHSSKSARDRDRLRQMMLEDLGWHIHRIWSTDWFRNPGREIDKVIAAAESLLEVSNVVSHK